MHRRGTVVVRAGVRARARVCARVSGSNFHTVTNQLRGPMDCLSASKIELKSGGLHKTASSQNYKICDEV